MTESKPSLLSLLTNAASGPNGIVFASSSLSNRNTHQDTRISYHDILNQSHDLGSVLSSLIATHKPRTVLIHFDNHLDNVRMFWAVVSSGSLPALSTPLPKDKEQRKTHILHLRTLLKDPICLTSEAILEKNPELELLHTITKEFLGKSSLHNAQNPTPQVFNENEMPSDAAVLMLTSGSTGNAKAVVLTTDQILASLEGKCQEWGSKTDSVFLNWIGFDHVANLVEIHLHAMHAGGEQVHVQSSEVLRDPILFVRLLDAFRVNYTFAPNFFLALLDKDLKAIVSADEDLKRLDLSCLRSITSGGEANDLHTANRLTRRLEAFRAPKKVIRLGYGLTEACAALAYGMLDPEYERRENHLFASIGKPILGAQMRIATATGETNPYEVGVLQIKGPMVFSHYYNNTKATQEAFTPDGWFVTGDRAYVDFDGKFNLSGREKEILNINSVKFAPQDIETALENASLDDARSSFFAVFAHRAETTETETYVVVYSSSTRDGTANMETIEGIARIASSIVTARPSWIVPLPQERLEKSSLGKLSRTKLQTQFQKGIFDDAKVQSTHPLDLYHRKSRQEPQTKTESRVVEVLIELLDLPNELVSTDQTIFELGLTSVSLFRFEKHLRVKFGMEKEVSIITFLSNPVITAIADAIDHVDSRIYNPVACIQASGDKIPLWLAHPASGNVLAFLPLAQIMNDRPLYALTARGLRKNEALFESIEEMCDIYFKHVKKAQPRGPYALTGYSLGTTVAFELSKRLEANGDQVAFCAALDSPPHIIPLVENLDWTAAAVLVSYFLELIEQDDVPQHIESFRGRSKLDIAKGCLDVAKPDQRQNLNLDPEQLLAIVNVTDNFGSMAKKYYPEGLVGKMDIFFCTPLKSVEQNRNRWINEHLRRWQDFSRLGIEFHECAGDHADMLNSTYVGGFKRVLDAVLEERGI